MKKTFYSFILIAFLCFTSAQGQTTGLNINSLSNLTGLSQLQNLVPQVMGTASTGLSGTQANNLLNQASEADNPLENEESAYFIQQLQSILYESVLDSIRLSTGQEETDSVPKSEIFGHQFFKPKNLGGFTKSKSFRAPESYTLDAGDELNISVFGSSIFNAKGEINEEGYLEIPKMGRVYLKGVTLGSSKKLIQNIIGRYVNTNTTQTEITLNYSRNITINIVGDVHAPGSYVIPAINSVFNALNAANGPSNIGSVRKIQVVRNGQTIKTFDLYAFLLKGNITNDFYLQDGDYIFVPTIEKVVGIGGSIRRSWKYELVKGETLSDLIEMAGGFRANSYTKSIQVKRFISDKVEIQDLDLATLNGGSSFQLEDGDEITIPEIPADYENYVKISGSVRFPGSYELKEGQRLDDLIAAAGGLALDAYLDRAYLTRKTEDLSTVIQKFNLKDVVLNEQSGENILLQRHDIIEVFSKNDFL